MIDFNVTFICIDCGGMRLFPALELSNKTPEALESELRAELGGTVVNERTEPRRWEYPVGGVLNEVYRDHEDIALNHLAAADIGFIEYLDAWIDKGLADGTLTVEKGARYREAIAARCAELGEVPHVREHIVALRLKAGDVLGVISPSESSSLIDIMGRYTRSLLDAVGNGGVGVLVFPPGTEFHVLEGAGTQVSDQIREHVDAKVDVLESKTTQASDSLLDELKQIRAGVIPADRIRAILAEEIRLGAAMGRAHQ